MQVNNERYSTGADGSQSNLGSDSPKSSLDGEKVVFSSDATNLVPLAAGETTDNGKRDIFEKDAGPGGETVKISKDPSGRESNNSNDSPAISSDGNYIVYASDASNLIQSDLNNKRDIFLLDTRPGGQTVLVSTDKNGIQANANSDKPAVATDGSYVYVSFESAASNLVTGDTKTCAGGPIVRISSSRKFQSVIYNPAIFSASLPIRAEQWATAIVMEQPLPQTAAS